MDKYEARARYAEGDEASAVVRWLDANDAAWRRFWDQVRAARMEEVAG